MLFRIAGSARGEGHFDLEEVKDALKISQRSKTSLKRSGGHHLFSVAGAIDVFRGVGTRAWKLPVVVSRPGHLSAIGCIGFTE